MAGIFGSASGPMPATTTRARSGPSEVAIVQPPSSHSMLSTAQFSRTFSRTPYSSATRCR